MKRVRGQKWRLPVTRCDQTRQMQEAQEAQLHSSTGKHNTTQLRGGGRLALAIELREEVEELALDGADVDRRCRRRCRRR